MRSQRIKLILLGFMLASGVALLLYLNHEPRADGQVLSEWLRTGLFDGPQSRGTAVTNAVRKIGAEAVPVLLAKLKAHDPAWKRYLRERWDATFLGRDWLADSSRHLHMEAWYGFSILGPQASAAIPELTRMLESDEPDAAAAALGFIGSSGWAVLKSQLTNASPRLQLAVLLGLCRDEINLDDVWDYILAMRKDTNSRSAFIAHKLILHHPEKPEALAVAVEGLRDTSSSMQSLTVISLTSWKTNALPLVPSILPLLTNANPNLRQYATQALWAIDPVTMRSHGVPQGGEP